MGDVLLQGVFVGGLYALLALGFVIIYKSSQVLNLAFGQQMVLLSYFLYYFTASLGFPVWAAILLVLVIGGISGLLMERFVRPAMRTSNVLPLLMLTLMISFAIQAVVLLVWGGETVTYTFSPTRFIDLFGAKVLTGALYAIVMAIVVFLLLMFVFRYTKSGLAMRVVAANQRLAQSLGIKVKETVSLTWVMSSLICGASAVLVGVVFGVTPDNGDLGLSKGLPVLLLGGMDSIPGALLGGLIIGAVEAIGGYWFASTREILPWIVMLLIVLIRPWGILGTKRIERI
jgi:branched-chain amino acid transport system permease protein